MTFSVQVTAFSMYYGQFRATSSISDICSSYYDFSNLDLLLVMMGMKIRIRMTNHLLLQLDNFLFLPLKCFMVNWDLQNHVSSPCYLSLCQFNVCSTFVIIVIVSSKSHHHLPCFLLLVLCLPHLEIQRK